MNQLIGVIGFLIVGIGLWGMATPGGLRRFMRNILARDQFIGLAAGLRFAIGVIFIIGADTTRIPLATSILGWITIAAAVGVVLMGRERLAGWAEWWLQRPDTLIRTWLIAAIAFGAFIVWLAT